MKHDDPVHGWLGASPDGLIESLTLEAAGPSLAASSSAAPWDAAEAADGSSAAPWDLAAAAGSLPPHVTAAVAAGHGPLAGPGRGILEIKCPHNKGQPELAVPPQHATWYYMPQVRQGAAYGACWLYPIIQAGGVQLTAGCCMSQLARQAGRQAGSGFFD